jgi:hypothetical protein
VKSATGGRNPWERGRPLVDTPGTDCLPPRQGRRKAGDSSPLPAHPAARNPYRVRQGKDTNVAVFGDLHGPRVPQPPGPHGFPSPLSGLLNSIGSIGSTGFASGRLWPPRRFTRGYGPLPLPGHRAIVETAATRRAPHRPRSISSDSAPAKGIKTPARRPRRLGSMHGIRQSAPIASRHRQRRAPREFFSTRRRSVPTSPAPRPETWTIMMRHFANMSKAEKPRKTGRIQRRTPLPRAKKTVLTEQTHVPAQLYGFLCLDPSPLAPTTGIRSRGGSAP